MHRFYVPDKLSIGETSIESLQIVHQLTKVLRIKPGETVIFFDGSGFDYIAEIVLYAQESMRVRIVEKIANQRELPVQIIICSALIKKDLMEWALEKGTEIGATRFVSLITERTLSRDMNVERGRKIIKEAAEQSGRAVVPDLSGTRTFDECLSECETENGLAIVFHADPEAADLKKIQTVLKKKGVAPIYLFIGPEGGFTDDEIVRAKEAGACIATLFPTTLRAETASVVFPAIVSALIRSSL